DDRPAIPESIKLQLLQESAFGCCKCGLPVYQYHHIIEHSAEPHFRPEDMMVLCPNCHQQASRGAMTAEETRRHKGQPYNRLHCHTGGMLTADHGLCAVEAGRIVLIAQGDLIRVDGEPLLGISRGPQGGLEFSLALYDQDDQLLVRIERNEWVAGQ